jgi:phosphate transport system protein
MSYLESLTREVKEMWALVLSQHKKTLTALTTFDKDLAREVVLLEERVNSCEQFIESDCEHYFSLHRSQTINVSRAMFVLKTARQLEIIGDLAKKIANHILTTSSAYSNQLISETNVGGLIRAGNNILELTFQAFDQTDISLAQIALNRIEISYEMVSNGKNSLAAYLTDHPQQIEQVLNLFSIFEHIKRTLEILHTLSQRIINSESIGIQL